jgi:hypothetical protein
MMNILRPAFTLLLIAFYAHTVRANGCFSDENLAELSTQQRPALVYVWSPRMVYSVHNLALASRAAAISGMAFVVLHDQRVPPAELAQVRMPSSDRPLFSFPAQVNKLPPEPIQIDANTDLATPPFVSPADFSQALCAKTLLEREALRHFPTAFVVTKNGIHPQPIVGAMPWSAWQQSIAQRLQP